MFAADGAGSGIFCLLDDRRPEDPGCGVLVVVGLVSFAVEAFRFRLAGVEAGTVGTSAAAEAGVRVGAEGRAAWLAA